MELPIPRIGLQALIEGLVFARKRAKNGRFYLSAPFSILLRSKTKNGAIASSVVHFVTKKPHESAAVRRLESRLHGYETQGSQSKNPWGVPWAPHRACPTSVLGVCTSILAGLPELAGAYNLCLRPSEVAG